MTTVGDQRGDPLQCLDFPVDARGRLPQRRSATRRGPQPAESVLTGRLAENQMAGFQRSQDTLYGPGKDTGGKALFDYNDLSLGIARAASAITSYYIIGYYSTHTALDGKFRRVKVSLANGLDPRSKAVPLQFTIPLASIAPGQYGVR